MKTPALTFRTSSPFGRSRLLFTVAVATCLLAAVAQRGLAADTGYKMIQPTPGGLSARPDITGLVRTNQQAILNWNGFAGPYQLERRTNLAPGGVWEAFGAAAELKTATVPLDELIGVFRVKGGAPGFTGAATCLDCHPQTHSAWSQTRHAGAFDTLKAIGQDKNASCLPCHTVGYGLSSGFKDEATTPYFAGVQCENCHGPASDHASNPDDLSKRPIKEMAAMLCGGCHDGFHHPTYDEWNTVPHSKVDPHVADYFLDPVNSVARMNSCGACHSGAVRLALLKGYENNVAPVLPSGRQAADTAVVCTVCHDSHTATANGSQLRTPRYSLIPFSYNTSTNTSFAKQYNPNVNTCGQCHNMRGAAWTDTGRPPHHSPQYNLLIGSGGVTNNTAPTMSAHRTNPLQCAGCHTHLHGADNPSEENPVFTGHSFEPTLEACSVCHTNATGALSAASLKAATQAEIEQSMLATKALLDSWGTTKADASLAKYGKLAWEFSSAGGLSNPTGVTTITGPTSAEQTVVPANIKQARFNLYLVFHDQSKGVHNANYARYLLSVAQEKVNAELNR